MASNLPPGVTDSMIPGNTPEDVAWEQLHEMIDDDCANGELSDMDAHVAWKLGFAAYERLRKLGGKLPHDGAL